MGNVDFDRIQVFGKVTLPVTGIVDTEDHQSSSRLKALLEDNVSQHLSEDALKLAWQRVVAFLRDHVLSHPLLGEFTRSILMVLLALFVLSTLAGVLASSYWSQREQLAFSEFERARGLNAQGQHDSALRHLRSAAHLEHHNQEYQMALASTLIQLGRYDEATLQLQEILRSDPTNAEANLRLARISAEEGDELLGITIQYYQRAIYGLWPGNPAESRIRTRFELVDFLASQGRLDLLRAELIVLASDLRDEPDQLERTAFLMLHAQSPDNAVTLIQRLLELAPGNVAAMAGMGKAYLELSNFPAAEQWLHRALRLNPASTSISAELALVREIRAMNPTRRGLTRQARAGRVNALLAMNYHPLYACATARILPEEVQQDLAAARERLEVTNKLPLMEEDFETELSLARQLYSHFGIHCEAERIPDSLRRLMASLAVNP